MASSNNTEAGIIDTLRADGALVLSLVASDLQGQIQGHVAFSPVSLSSDDVRSWYALGPIAVHPDRQRRGVGKALITEGLSELRARRAAGVILIGDPAYYRRFGFHTRAALRYNGAASRYLQSISFRADPPAGDVHFHPAFNAAETT